MTRSDVIIRLYTAYDDMAKSIGVIHCDNGVSYTCSVMTVCHPL